MYENREASDKILESQARIKRLFWLAAEDMLDCEDLEDALFLHSPKHVAEAVGIKSIAQIDWADFDFITGTPAEWLLDVMDTSDQLGFLAEITVPQLADFDDEGNGSFTGTRHLELIYAETRQELAEKIVAVSERWKEHDRKEEAEAKE